MLVEFGEKGSFLISNQVVAGSSPAARTTLRQRLPLGASLDRDVASPTGILQKLKLHLA